MGKNLLYFCILILYGFQLISYIVVYNFSIVNYDYYINHYSEFLIGHVIAVFIVFLLYCIILFSYYIFRKNNIKDCIRKTIYITLPPILIMSIYILYSIDYSLIDWIYLLDKRLSLMHAYKVPDCLVGHTLGQVN